MVVATGTRKGIIGIETEAFGANPSQVDKVYQFRYMVVELGDVIPSHNDTLTPNPKYPRVKRWLRDHGSKDILGIDTPIGYKPPRYKMPALPKAPTRKPKATSPRGAKSPSVRIGKQYYTKLRGSVGISRRPIGRRGRR